MLVRRPVWLAYRWYTHHWPMVWFALLVTSQPIVSYSDGVCPTLPQLARDPSQLQRSSREMYQADGPGCCSLPKAPYSLTSKPDTLMPRADSSLLACEASVAGSPGSACQLRMFGTTPLALT